MHGGDAANQWPGTTEATSEARGAVALYDTYADALFAFCVGLTHDRDLAERALHDTLVAGAVLGRGLREPSRVRALLYALARSECARTAGGGTGPGVVEQVLAAGAGAWIVPDRHRLLPLAPYALWAVDEPERIALDLSVRHGLSAAETADVLAIPQRRVERLLARGRTQFEQSLAVYAVATHARRDCPELAMLLPDGGVAVDCTLRPPLHLHVDSCPDCAALRPGEVDAPTMLTGGVRPAAPFQVRTRLLGAGAAAGALVGPARVGRNGFPKGTGRPRSRVPVAVGCLVAASLVLGFAALGRIGGGRDKDSPVALSTSEVVPRQPVPVHPPAPSKVAEAVPTSAAPSASSAPTRTSTPSRSPAKPTAKATRSAKPGSAPPVTTAAGPIAAAEPVDGTAAQPRSAQTQRTPAAGELAWSATSVQLGAGDTPQSIRLTATKAAVTWSLSVSENDWLTVSAQSGTLADGQSISITLVADPDKAPAGTWEVVISAHPDGRTLTVAGIGRRASVR